MTATSEVLKNLHQLHVQLQAARDELARGPKQVEARKQYTARKQAELDAHKERLLDAKKAADEKNLQLKSNEAKIADLKSKLNTASSNREYDIIRSQIDADTMANSVLEDEILEALEKVDSRSIQLKTLEDEVAAAKAAEDRIAKEVADRRPQLEQDAARLEQELRAAESDLPGQVAEVYRRLVGRHGSGALAAVANKACSACNDLLSPQQTVQVNTGEFVFCRSCGRLMYRGGSP